MKSYQKTTCCQSPLNSSSDDIINIFLNRGIPGGGKTTSMINKIKRSRDARRLYFGVDHDFLSEVGDKLEGVDYRHWKGINKKCPSSKLLIRDLIAEKVPVGVICNKCKRKKCSYKEQFQNLPNTILLPLPYINTTLIDAFNPDEIILDDCAFNVFSPKSLNEISENLNELFNKSDKKYTADFFINNPNKLKDIYYILLNQISN
jgi:hypothetical protein